MHTHCIHVDSCDTLKNILSANQLFSLIDVKRKFINSDNHKFHQYQENDYLSSSLNLSRRDCMVVEFTTTCASLPITTYVVSLNPMHGEEYLIKQHVIKDFQ